MVYIPSYSSLNDSGTSGSKNIITQYVDTPFAIFDAKFDIALNKKSIILPPFSYY